MKKTAIIVALAAILLVAPGVKAKMYDRDLTIPTIKNAVVDGKIKYQIGIAKETSTVNPWLYVDVKLDETKAKQSKFNYAELALKRAFGFMRENRLSLRDGDFYIILNNGFVINKKNFMDKKVTDMAMKQILEPDFYRGDTLFKIAYLYHDNAVQRTTNWNLIDTIDLPAGSSHTVSKHYTAGISKTEEINMGQTLGLRLISETEAGAKFDYKFISSKFMAKLNTDLNLTRTKAFKDSKEIQSSFESNTNIAYNPSDIDKVVLRYQLVDNYKVDPNAFKEGTKNLQQAMNQGGRNIIKLTPSAGQEGIDVPMDQIFDVTLNK